MRGYLTALLFLYLCTMKKNSRYLYIIISIIIGAFFLFSAYAKTMPIDTFANTIFNRVNVSWQLASWTARFFIGIEAAIGLLLLIHIYGKKKWVLWGTLLLLILFSGYLAGLWYMEGNDVDCGCMGNVVKMNPMWSIIKNAVLAILTAILLHYDQEKISSNKHKASIALTLLIIIIPFIAFPNKLAIDILYKDNAKGLLTKTDLTKGKHVVAFLSLTCPHCMVAADEMEKMKEKNPEFPFHIVFMDHSNRDTLLANFISEAGIKTLPYDFLEEKKFISLAGIYVPTIFLLDGTKVDDRIDPKQLKESDLQAWLKK